jgi:DNA-binding XRE family transcriptional regulator
MKNRKIRSLADRALSVEEHVGIRICQARRALALTSSALATNIGVAEARMVQVEQGQVRIAAGELFDIASHVGKPISYFFS